MGNLKKGDIVCVKKLKRVKIPKLAKLNIVYADENNVIVTGEILLKKNEVFKIGESKMQYEESNRYKLAQAIKKTGLKVGELSIVAKGNANYFGNYHNKSRFNERGDIPEARLNELLTDLAFAEREVLGIGAKTVDDELYTAVVDSKGDVVDIVKTGTVEDTPVGATHYMEFSNGEVQYFKTDESIEEKPASNKLLFIVVAVVIFIALILFILNNSQVV